MRDKLLNAVKSQHFKLTLMLGTNGLIESAQILTSLGLDVNEFVTQALKSINVQLNSAAYDITDLEKLLEEAQDIAND